VQGAHGAVRPHGHGDDLVDVHLAALLDLHRRFDRVGIERVEVGLAGTVDSHRVGVDALGNRGVRNLFDQDADLQVNASLGWYEKCPRGLVGRAGLSWRAGILPS